MFNAVKQHNELAQGQDGSPDRVSSLQFAVVIPTTGPLRIVPVEANLLPSKACTSRGNKDLGRGNGRDPLEEYVTKCCRLERAHTAAFAQLCASAAGCPQFYTDQCNSGSCASVGHTASNWSLEAGALSLECFYLTAGVCCRAPGTKESSSCMLLAEAMMAYQELPVNQHLEGGVRGPVVVMASVGKQMAYGSLVPVIVDIPIELLTSDALLRELLCVVKDMVVK